MAVEPGLISNVGRPPWAIGGTMYLVAVGTGCGVGVGVGTCPGMFMGCGTMYGVAVGTACGVGVGTRLGTATGVKATP